MEWKSTNISKKEFEQKQKEFMREAMDMSKRARPKYSCGSKHGNTRSTDDGANCSQTG